MERFEAAKHKKKKKNALKQFNSNIMDLFGYFECRWNEPSLIIQIRMEKFDAAQQNNVLKDSLGYSEFRGNVPLLNGMSKGTSLKLMSTS